MKIPFLDLKREIYSIRNEINESIDKVIHNANFILGNEVNDFESNFAKFINTSYCIGVANGTDALEIAVESLNLSENDEIITQSNTYVATCFGVTKNKLKLKLVDIDSDTYQMDLNELEKKITPNTKCIIIVHLTGSCCNMERLLDIVKRNNLLLIEDCAQSHGAYYKNKRLGTFGIISTFSFYPGKNLGAFGDAGAICTNDVSIYSQILKLRNNGSIEKYKHEIVGRNSRLDTLQSAVLSVKLKYLDINNEKRRKISQLYFEKLYFLKEIILPKIIDNCIPVYHLYIIRANKRDKLKKYLEDNNIETGIHYPICISNLKCYENYFDNSNKNAEENSKCILSLPMYPDLTENEIDIICKHIINFYFLEMYM
jgi:dTDP-4-amino-4,6-dideoxygalactose transaminase